MRLLSYKGRLTIFSRFVTCCHRSSDYGEGRTAKGEGGVLCSLYGLREHTGMLAIVVYMLRKLRKLLLISAIALSHHILELEAI